MFGVKNNVIVNKEEIEKILQRSISTILPSKELLVKKLCSGERLRFYIGADATGPELHLGHATNFIFLEKIRRLGHEIIILFGDFTAMIGDPSDKMAARKPLLKKEVELNIKSWKSQVSKILNFSGNNPAKIVKNSKWLSKLSFEEVLKLSSNFTVQQMLERDMFEKRTKENKPVFLHEFMYPLMQGYDSVVLDVDVEVGGNDQLFNMLAGRTLQKVYNNREKFVIATTLLVNPKTGKKLMSKSEGGYIALSDEADNMYGKVMALPDETLISMFLDCTYLSIDEIEKIKSDLVSNVNPKVIKEKLAKEIVSIYHGEKLAEKATQNFQKTFSKGGMLDDAKEIQIGIDESLVERLVSDSIVESKTELRRLTDALAITDLISGKKMSFDDLKQNKTNLNLKIGKHRFVKVTLK